MHAMTTLAYLRAYRVQFNPRCAIYARIDNIQLAYGRILRMHAPRPCECERHGRTVEDAFGISAAINVSCSPPAGPWRDSDAPAREEERRKERKDGGHADGGMECMQSTYTNDRVASAGAYALLDTNTAECKLSRLSRIPIYSQHTTGGLEYINVMYLCIYPSRSASRSSPGTRAQPSPVPSRQPHTCHKTPLTERPIVETLKRAAQARGKAIGNLTERRTPPPRRDLAARCGHSPRVGDARPKGHFTLLYRDLGGLGRASASACAKEGGDHDRRVERRRLKARVSTPRCARGDDDASAARPWALARVATRAIYGAGRASARVRVFATYAVYTVIGSLRSFAERVNVPAARRVRVRIRWTCGPERPASSAAR